MTELKVRKMRFAFDEFDVPFRWNEQNPAFSSMANAVSFLAIAFEKMIVQAMREALPTITDPEVAAEADAFMKQEGQHATAHRQHVRGLIRRYPDLQETLDRCVAAFDELTATTSLAYRLAYIADLEATFTPTFKLMLDNHATLFAPGDDRVSSLFLWHFVEEVEHRSSGLIIYDGVIGNRYYRLRQVPAVFKHVFGVVRLAAEGFNKHVPLADRKVDAMCIFANHRYRHQLLRRLPRYRGGSNGELPDAFGHLPLRELLPAVAGIVRSQLPNHDPAKEKLPVFAAEWFRRYDNGDDVSQWYTVATASAAN